jgi:hypothetical protein
VTYEEFAEFVTQSIEAVKQPNCSVFLRNRTIHLDKQMLFNPASIFTSRVSDEELRRYFSMQEKYAASNNIPMYLDYLVLN